MVRTIRTVNFNIIIGCFVGAAIPKYGSSRNWPKMKHLICKIFNIERKTPFII